MARMTTILYASAANLAQLTTELKPARDSGQPIRLIALEEFRGETEQSAGAVYVDTPKDVEGEERKRYSVLFDAIAQAYPHLNLQEYEPGSFDKAEEPSTHQMDAADDTMRDLRMALINAGGSAPANANAEELSNLIAAQRARTGLGSRTPVLPTPATAGTVIPDSTPVLQRIGADALVSESATGTSPEALKMVQDEAGAGSGATTPGAFSPPASETVELADLGDVKTHAAADKIAADEGVDVTKATTVDAKIGAIKAHREKVANG